MTAHPSDEARIRHDSAERDGAVSEVKLEITTSSGDDEAALDTQARPSRSARRLAGIGALTVVVAGSTLVAWPLLWSPAADESIAVVHGRSMAETSGYIAHMDRETQTMSVSRSIFGWRSVLVTVNPDTVIMVQEREGGLGDLVKDTPVHVIYEVDGDRRVARSIGLGGRRAAALRTEPPKDVPATSASRPAITPPAAERLAAPPRAPVAPSGRVTPEPPAGTPSPVSSTPVVGNAPVVSSPQAATSVRSVRPAPVTRRETAGGSAAEEVPARVLPRSEPTDTDAGDGSAAIDWLINESQRR